jgi:hypothetical protein
MGWANGSELAKEVYDLVRSYLPENKRKKVATKFYDLFTDMDADDFSGDSNLEKDAGINQDLDN